MAGHDGTLRHSGARVKRANPESRCDRERGAGFRVRPYGPSRNDGIYPLTLIPTRSIFPCIPPRRRGVSDQRLQMLGREAVVRGLRRRCGVGLPPDRPKPLAPAALTAQHGKSKRLRQRAISPGPPDGLPTRRPACGPRWKARRRSAIESEAVDSNWSRVHRGSSGASLKTSRAGRRGTGNLVVTMSVHYYQNHRAQSCGAVVAPAFRAPSFAHVGPARYAQ
jgi:hypothetical protein